MDENNKPIEAEQKSTTAEEQTDQPNQTAGASASVPAENETATAPSAAQPIADAALATPAATPAQSAAIPAPLTPAAPAAQPATVEGSYPTATPLSPTPALVLGILAIVFCWMPIVGIILGIIAIVQAGKYFKSGGAESSAKGGKICGIVGIVLSVVMIISICIMFIVGLIAINELNSYSASVGSTSIENISSNYVDAEDQEVYDAVDPYLDQLKNKDPQMVANIANLMESSFDEIMADYSTGFTLKDCGVEPTELASAMIDGFDYSPDFVYNSSGEVEANYEVTVRSLTEVLDMFYDDLIEMMTDIYSGDVTEQEVYPRIGAALMDAVNSTQPDSAYFDVEVEDVDGAWQIDLDSWQEELEHFFSFI